jgi:cell division protein FtsQ
MSRKPPAKRRRVLNWAPILWILFFAQAVAALYWSPLFAVRKVRVVGLPASDEARVRQALQAVRGIPALRLNVAAIESRVQAGDDVRQARLERNVFGRGLLRVTLHEPSARLTGESLRYLSREGHVFFSTREIGGLPLLTVAAPGRPNLTWSDAWPALALALACVAVRETLPPAAWRLELDAAGMLSLRNEAGGRVELGSTDSIPEKLAALRRILEARPQVMRQVREINLAAPDAPVVVPLDGRQ